MPDFFSVEGECLCLKAMVWTLVKNCASEASTQKKNKKTGVNYTQVKSSGEKKLRNSTLNVSSFFNSTVTYSICAYVVWLQGRSFSDDVAHVLNCLACYLPY